MFRIALKGRFLGGGRKVLWKIKPKMRKASKSPQDSVEEASVSGEENEERSVTEDRSQLEPCESCG